METDTVKRPVDFEGDGARLAGDLYLPAGNGPHPGVVLTGPFSNVKEQVPATYAELFAQRGFAALAFDHRGWGASEGQPRQHDVTSIRVAESCEKETA